MPFVKRDAAGVIVAVSSVGDDMHAEHVEVDDAGLRVFLEGLGPAPQLAASDLPLVRVLEDVVDLLVERAVIRFTDLPAAAQDKLSARRSARAELRQLNLLDDDDGLI
ncbi:hypothetical protein [Pseudothauera lacus]|uniref:Tryptophan synthase subunit beta like protein n=1 Tax=Pseudothauera lacus TaxID=2136175 RepID=A0A2T4IBK3_9RHOO|nr:hypothetical protein [Pseudothauera lacus]PTD95165.1 hypothetical protein C8261_15800 [Pseudothauera lacus]